MGGGKERDTAASVVPRAAMDSLRETLASTEELSANLAQFLSMADPDVLAELPPLQRARAFLVLAKATSTLLAGIAYGPCMVLILHMEPIHLLGVTYNSDFVVCLSDHPSSGELVSYLKDFIHYQATNGTP